MFIDRKRVDRYNNVNIFRREKTRGGGVAGVMKIRDSRRVNILQQEGDFMKNYVKRASAFVITVAMLLSMVLPGFAAEEASNPGDIARGVLAQIISEKLELTGEAENIYTDLPADGQYTPYILACVEAGIMNGRGNGIMAPGDMVTRQEACKMICIALGLKPVEGHTDFADDADIAGWALPYVNAMKAAGYLESADNGRFLPTEPITRASAVKMLDDGLAAPGDGDGEEDDALKETGHTSDYDADDPYGGVNVGLFHHVPIQVGDETAGEASYYLPEGMDPWAPAVIILTPNNTTARDFSGTETGLAWRAVADENKIGVAILGPKDGGTWNLDLDGEGRDDTAVLNQLYLTMRKKGTNLKGAFSMDKSHTALVGYEEGGAAALLFGARWASDFSAIAAVDATAVPTASLAAVGEQYVMPFPGDTDLGIEEEAIAAKTVDTPVWFINSAKGNDAAVAYYTNAIQNGPNKATTEAEIKNTTEAQTPAEIWSQFLGTYKRFMAMQLPGRVTKAVEFTEANGFTVHEETVNGEPRRWATYVPKSYDGTSEVPLVLVMHGYTASMYAIAEESRWFDVAEDNGFIVVFAQGMVRPADLMGNVPTAMWLAGPFAALAGEGTDPDVDVNFLSSLLDKMEADYKIDAGRIYATGHSNGSLMTWAIGSKFADRFAAIAPVGYMSSPVGTMDSDVLLPSWSFLGQYDSAGDPTLVENNSSKTVEALKAWNEQNGTNEDQMTTDIADVAGIEDSFVTRSFSNSQNVPLVKFTEVKDTPHVYLQEESQAIWDDFFSKYSRKDGKLYYQSEEDGQPVEVTRDAYVSSTGWYAPAEKAAYTYDSDKAYDAVITGKCDGVMIKNGNDIASATVYIPEGAQPYAPVVLVLTPDGTTAAQFAESDTGKAWIKLADDTPAGVAFDSKPVVAFMGPEAGGSWNLELDEDGRDDAALVNALYTTIRSRSLSGRHPAGVNRGWISLVGYEEGGAAALLFGARHAANFSSITAVDATEVPAASLTAVGKELVAPFTGDGSTNGLELNLAAKDVPSAVWMIGSNKGSVNDHVVSYFKTASAVEANATANSDGEQVFANKDNAAKTVIITEDSDGLTPSSIWSRFIGTHKRLRGLEKGGRLAITQDYSPKAFTVTEKKFGDEMRRYITYVPTNYDELTKDGGKLPLVLVLHGYGATMTGIAEESRWYDLAEENGFIAVFANGMNRDVPMMGNVPSPMWMGGSFGQLGAALGLDSKTDVNFLNQLLDEMEETYAVDTAREYVTGHSNGSMMTWEMAIQSTDRFAAIGPCGYMVPWNEDELTSKSKNPIAIWGFLGEYDSVGSAKLEEGNNTTVTLQTWNKINGIDETTAKASKETVEYANSFATETFYAGTNKDVPLMRFTEVADTPHVYLQEEAEHLWDFFSRFSRGEDGKLYYQADAESDKTEVVKGEYKADDGWYAAAEN